MATIFIGYDTEVDYSLLDGRVRAFKLRGDVQYDEDSGVSIHGWEWRLRTLTDALHARPRSMRGVYAFEEWLAARIGTA